MPLSPQNAPLAISTTITTIPAISGANPQPPGAGNAPLNFRLLYTIFKCCGKKNEKALLPTTPTTPIAPVTTTLRNGNNYKETTTQTPTPVPCGQTTTTPSNGNNCTQTPPPSDRITTTPINGNNLKETTTPSIEAATTAPPININVVIDLPSKPPLAG